MICQFYRRILVIQIYRFKVEVEWQIKKGSGRVYGSNSVGVHKIWRYTVHVVRSSTEILILTLYNGCISLDVHRLHTTGLGKSWSGGRESETLMTYVRKSLDESRLLLTKQMWLRVKGPRRPTPFSHFENEGTKFHPVYIFWQGRTVEWYPSGLWILHYRGLNWEERQVRMEWVRGCPHRGLSLGVTWRTYVWRYIQTKGSLDYTLSHSPHCNPPSLIYRKTLTY